MTRTKQIAEKYGRDMSDVERCMLVGQALYKIRYAYVTMPDRYDELLQKKQALRPAQIPEWVKGDPNVEIQVSCGGRGSGKSFGNSTYILCEALQRPNLRVGILGPDFKISVNVGITGRSGIKTLCDQIDPSLIANWDKVKNVLTFINGSQIFCFSSENPGSLEGPEFHLYWIDEMADLANAGGDDCIFRKSVEPGVRLPGDNNEPTRILISGTPAATELVKDLHDSYEENPDQYAWSTLATRDNIANLDATKVERMYRRAKGTRFERMKLEGELILESPNAMLNPDDIAAITIGDGLPSSASRDPKDADVLTVMVDSNHSDDAKSDECGIVIHGFYKGRVRDEDTVHVHADASISGGPKAWPDRLVQVLIAYPEIRTILVEDDKSLVIDFVTRVIRDRMEEIGRKVRVKPVKHKNRSKKVRADPVAGLYSVGRVIHDPCNRVPEWADLSKLVWQWISWDPKASGKKAKSPDRLDADVYGVEYHLIRSKTPDTLYSPSDLMG